MGIEKDHDKILIVGGGLSGLALAQIFRKYNIASQVFERDDPLHVRAQGWAVMLIDCLSELQELLPSDLGELREVSVNHITKDADVISVVDGITMQPLTKFGDVPYGSPGFALRAHRENLRAFLSQNIDVQCGKKFDRYEEDDRGVTAYFKDGTSAHGSILVGADGANSKIRSQLLNEHATATRHINLIGAGEVGPEIFKPLRELGAAAVIGTQKHLRVLIGQLYMNPDLLSAGFYWFVTYRVDDPARENEWIAKASKQELFDKAMEVTSDTSPFLVDKLRAMGPESMALNPFKFLEYVTPEEMPRSRVTLIGDALHTMIPFRAAGANTALLDACDLAKAISRGNKIRDRLDWSKVFDQYHAVALPRGRKTVLISRAAGDDEDGRW